MRGKIQFILMLIATLIVPVQTSANDRVSAPLTLVQLETVQRERTGTDQEELSIDAYDAYSRKKARLGIRRHARGAGDLLDSCEKFALLAMNRPDKWQLSVYLSSANRESASLETLRKEREEWRVMKVDLDRLGGPESIFRCALERIVAQPK